MEARQFLEISKKFLSIPAEAAYRSAVSRAYYALFHEASGFLAQLGIQTARGPQAHGQLPARFNNCGVEEGSQIARQLNELHRQRLFADYDLNYREFAIQFKTGVWIVKAEKAVMQLKALAASPNLCDQIRKGIRAYEEKLKT
jgi:uncharacterized protein (UPF0332 family)